MLGALAALAVPGAARAQDYCIGIFPPNEPSPQPASRPLDLGINPEGYSGSILPVPPPAKPNDQAAIFHALDLLKPASTPFTVHLYAVFGDNAQANARTLDDAAARIDAYAAAGYGVEQVFRYVSRSGDAAGFAAYMRSVVARLAPKPALKGLQVTNEVNQPTAPDASDGAFPQARRALVDGVIAADDEARKIGVASLPVGFNWFYRLAPGMEEDFWDEIGSLGGDAFRDAVDWVGLDAYPGTFFPPLDPTYGRSGMLNAMDVLRNCFMPLAGLDDSVEIRITENGWATDLVARTPQMQAQFLETMLGAVNEFRANYNVTEYLYFDLRDGDTSSLDFGQHWGLLNDDYTEKPAFRTYCNLVAELSGDAGGCAASAPRVPPPGATPGPAGGGPTGGDAVYSGSAVTLRAACKRRRSRGKRHRRRCARKHRRHHKRPR